ncbi:MAG: tyrosine-type recombinase/integrase [Mycobacteriales bacterium]
MTEPDWVEAIRGRCDRQAAASLWTMVPEPLRLSRYAESSVPADYAGAFCHDPTWRAGIDLAGLPDPIRQELAWCVFRIIELGGKIATPSLSMLVHRLGEVVADHTGRSPASLLDLSVHEWCQQVGRAAHRRTGRLPAATTMVNLRRLLTRMMRLLVLACDTGPWWVHDRWNPVEDPRIPLRDHEPMGRYSVRFDAIGARWLRAGLQWHCKVGLETGALRWSSVHRRVVAVKEFDAFLRDRGIDRPCLTDRPAGVRALMLEFLGQLRSRQSVGRRNAGKRLSPGSVQRQASDVEQFYLFMAENAVAAATALDEPGWRELGPQHAGFYRRGELPASQPPRHEGQVIDDGAMSKIMSGLSLLGAPVAEGGLGDQQAMRITMLVALLGRRVSEICLLDPDPIEPLLPAAPPRRNESGGDGEAQAPVAKLRYQQTKIDSAPNTVLVHAEVVAIIREQQQWACRYFAEHGAPGKTPKYLFLATQMNRNGDRPYSGNTLRALLTRLAAGLDVRDSTGALIDFNRTHRFRHTVATSLLNGGVPIHVLQRYLGHLTPTMSMTYAQTLQSTAEAEFLRYRKVTADARDVDLDPRDLYDMLELDRRTDRILPNGWCLLPPRQVCVKGNACLTCDKFATDGSFLPELRAQKDRTATLIDERRAAFLARTGKQMGEDNVWLAGRRQEHDALGRIIVTLGRTRYADDDTPAVRGAGVTARTDAITDRSSVDAW